MKFGVREICNVVFRAKDTVKIGNSIFQKGQPVLYIDTATTSTMEGAATTVYAQGGRGNTRLMAWEGEKTLTFTVEDALLSPIGFSVLSGAGLIKQDTSEKTVHVHTTAAGVVGAEGKIELSKAKICSTAPIFVVKTEADGSLTGDIVTVTDITQPTYDDSQQPVTAASITVDAPVGTQVFVDFYIEAAGDKISEIQIDAANFAGYYYVEADTLFRRQSDGVDMPANITFPNVKIQSNFTFTMAATGDPSTFTFTMDAFPDYTYFDKTRKVLCVIQVVEDASAVEEEIKSVMLHNEDEVIFSADDIVKDSNINSI